MRLDISEGQLEAAAEEYGNNPYGQHLRKVLDRRIQFTRDDWMPLFVRYHQS